jgi:hypothetical protein
VARAQQDGRVQALLLQILRLQAECVAEKISQHIREIERQVGWTTQLSLTDSSTFDVRGFDAVRLLRQSPAPITEFAQLDSTGKEQLRLNRSEGTVVASKRDFSQDPIFTVAVAKKVYYGPVYLHRSGEALANTASPMFSMRRTASLRIPRCSWALRTSAAVVSNIWISACSSAIFRVWPR